MLPGAVVEKSANTKACMHLTVPQFFREWFSTEETSVFFRLLDVNRFCFSMPCAT